MDIFKFFGKLKVWQENRMIGEFRNHITQLWQELVASLGIDTMYGMGSSIEAGQSFAITQYPTYSNYLDMQNTDQMVTAYFLNLPKAERDALSSKSNHLPIFNSAGEIDTDKVVGYATFKHTATGTKEGYLQTLEGVDLVNPSVHGCLFKWDAGVAAGTFNCIAIGANVMVDKYAGYRTARGIEFNCPVLGENVAGGYYLRPGVKSSDGSVVITGDNEILIGDTTDIDAARKVVNLITGEVTNLDTTDSRYGYALVNADQMQMVVGDYLIYTSSMTTLNSKNIITGATNTITSSGYGAFMYNGYLYSPYNETAIRAYNPTTFSRVSSADLTAESIGIPTDFQQDSSNQRLYIAQISDSKYLIACLPTPSVDKKSYSPKAFICSDISNVGGSFIETVPGLSGVGCFEVNGEVWFSSSIVPLTLLDNQNVYYKGASGSAITVQKKGVKLTKQGFYGNMLSFCNYDEDKTLDPTQSTYLKYTYSFEG